MSDQFNTQNTPVLSIETPERPPFEQFLITPEESEANQAAARERILQYKKNLNNPAFRTAVWCDERILGAETIIAQKGGEGFVRHILTGVLNDDETQFADGLGECYGLTGRFELAVEVTASKAKKEFWQNFLDATEKMPARGCDCPEHETVYGENSGSKGLKVPTLSPAQIIWHSELNIELSFDRCRICEKLTARMVSEV